MPHQTIREYGKEKSDYRGTNHKGVTHDGAHPADCPNPSSIPAIAPNVLSAWAPFPLNAVPNGCAAAFPDGRRKTVRATMEGRIGYEEKGENGFGYDPIFYLPEYGCTSAELSMEEKNKISHRGKALRLIKEELV